MAENQVSDEKGNDAADKIEGAAESEKSLEELLKEFPEDETPAKQEPQADEKPNSDLESRLARIEAAEFKKELDTAIGQTVDVLIDAEGYEKTPKRIARGFLHALAEENPAFQRAFQNRQQNPEAWKRSMNWAAKEFRKDYAPSGDDTLGDIAAAKASIRGQSEQPERPSGKYSGKTPEEIRDMPAADLKAYKRSLGGRS